MQYVTFQSEFSRQIRSASHHKLIDLMKELRAVTHERYGGGKPAKVELVEKGFTHQELMKFLSVVDDHEDYACFMFMATLALRKGEVLMLRGRDLQGDQLVVAGLKGGFSFPPLQLPPSLLSLAPARGPDEKLFTMSYKILSDRFHKYREKAGMDQIYAHTKPCGSARNINRQFRFSLHSFRHYGIQQFFRVSQDLELTRRFARHRRIDTTVRYLRRTMKDEVEQYLQRLPLSGNEVPLNEPTSIKMVNYD